TSLLARRPRLGSRDQPCPPPVSWRPRMPLNDRLAGRILIGVAGLLCFPTAIFAGALAQIHADARDETVRQEAWWHAQATAEALARVPARLSPTPTRIAVRAVEPTAPPVP